MSTERGVHIWKETYWLFLKPHLRQLGGRFTSVFSVYLCCSVLQRVAACCSVFSVYLCVAVCCTVLQCVAVCCSVLQCVAGTDTLVDLSYNGRMVVVWVCMIVYECVAACCSVLQCVAVRCRYWHSRGPQLQRPNGRCMSVLQRVIVCCSVSQCVAVTDTHTYPSYDGRVVVLSVCCSVYLCVTVCCSYWHSHIPQLRWPGCRFISAPLAQVLNSSLKAQRTISFFFWG